MINQPELSGKPGQAPLAAARRLIDGGQSVVSVARTLGVGRSSLYRALERERATAGAR
ncbi:helix-turn-helix domain-containing protein [Cellulomonas persica]|uniref:helix-turn-helix domain-containing protein n=1 Tax=Cellulomonas persica TaxID=76861 RepID=UPI0011BE0B6E